MISGQRAVAGNQWSSNTIHPTGLFGRAMPGSIRLRQTRANGRGITIIWLQLTSGFEPGHVVKTSHTRHVSSSCSKLRHVVGTVRLTGFRDEALREPTGLLDCLPLRDCEAALCNPFGNSLYYCQVPESGRKLIRRN